MPARTCVRTHTCVHTHAHTQATDTDTNARTDTYTFTHSHKKHTHACTGRPRHPRAEGARHAGRVVGALQGKLKEQGLDMPARQLEPALSQLPFVAFQLWKSPSCMPGHLQRSQFLVDPAAAAAATKARGQVPPWQPQAPAAAAAAAWRPTAAAALPAGAAQAQTAANAAAPPPAAVGVPTAVLAGAGPKVKVEVKAEAV